MPTHIFHRLTPHTSWLSPDGTTDRPVLGVIAGRSGSLLVDAGASPAHVRLLLRHITLQHLPDPRFVALTHWHWDHVFGTAVLPFPTFASEETARIVSRMAHFDWSDAALDQRVADGLEIAFCRDMLKAELPDRRNLKLRPPDITFRQSVEIDLGGVSARLIHIVTDHSPDATIVYVPRDKVVFLGDCIYPDIYHGPYRYTARLVFPLHAQLLALDAEFYLPGHHEQPLTRAEMQQEASLLRTVWATIERVGEERDAVLAALPAALGQPLNEDHIEVADAFLAGLKLPEVESVL